MKWNRKGMRECNWMMFHLKDTFFCRCWFFFIHRFYVALIIWFHWATAFDIMPFEWWREKKASNNNKTRYHTANKTDIRSREHQTKILVFLKIHIWWKWASGMMWRVSFGSFHFESKITFCWFFFYSLGDGFWKQILYLFGDISGTMDHDFHFNLMHV